MTVPCQTRMGGELIGLNILTDVHSRSLELAILYRLASKIANADPVIEKIPTSLALTIARLNYGKAPCVCNISELKVQP